MKKIVLILCLAFGLASAEEIMVLAAASLKFVLEDIKAEFLKDRKGDKIEVSYIASGKAYNQIINGSPAQFFIAADTGYTQKLYDSKKTSDVPVNYVKGKLVLVSYDKSLKIDSLEVLKDSKITKIALPNPKLAPYGVAGEQALQKSKIYDAVKSKLVTGESIGQTYQYIKTGASEIGFNALSMVIKDKDANYYEVDSALYEPIAQAMVITEAGKNSKLAKDFKAYILSDKAQEIFASYGYDKP